MSPRDETDWSAMSPSDQTNILINRITTRVPFGLQTAADFRAETERNAFKLELRDCNGAPILTIVTSVATGSDQGATYIYAPGLMIADEYLIRFVEQRNRETVGEIAQ